MNKRQAIKECREEANAIIEQHERWAKGWDKGAYRDDDTLRQITIQESIEGSVMWAMCLAEHFGKE